VQIWNTSTRTKETFQAGPIVRLYVCGVTPYATTHLGHARTYLIFDVLVRELERLGHGVRYTQNVTDVDDPLFERAQKLGIAAADLARQSTRAFQDDLAALRIRPPDFFPWASDEIPTMQQLIETMLAEGYAYQSEGRVYFRVRRFSRYGSFSRLSREEMIAVAADRGEDPTDPAKEDPLDFVLWKPSRVGEASWPSPWGTGRPGWHIECSAMALHYLGPALDIHGGGSDLIFPHHENEIAQSESVTGHVPLARYWLHVEMVRMDGTKMSKSLGNLALVRDLRTRFNPVAIRHYLLNTHYRSLLDYSEDELRASAEQVALLERALATREGRASESEISTLENRFDAALADDLDTPAALNALDAAARVVLDAPSGGVSDDGSPVLWRMAARLGLAEIWQAI
jgi:L-cysteine:1D-myo-inositol 2-amino-2-deoxy-alpha-D-glucopyranoside ligase